MKLPYFNLLLFGEEESTQVPTETQSETQVNKNPDWLSEIKGKYDKEEFSQKSEDD